MLSPEIAERREKTAERRERKLDQAQRYQKNAEEAKQAGLTKLQLVPLGHH
jgi:hypothetical protein